MATDFVVFYLLLAVIGVGYLLLGTVQAFAIAAGLQHRGFRGWQAVIMAALVAYLPLVGSAAAVRNAAHWLGVDGTSRRDTVFRAVACDAGIAPVRLIVG